VIEGFNQESSANIRDERLRFQNRGLLYGQLRGEHKLASIRWRPLQARATSADPDLRETVYAQNAAGGLSFRDGSLSGQHFFSAQGETSRAVGLDYAQPLTKNPDRPKTLSVGGLLSLRGRSFASRRLRFQRKSGADAAVYARNPNALFTPETVADRFDLVDETKATDTYDARYDVTAGYVMSDLTVLRGVRVIFGARVEAAKQSIDSFDPFAGTANVQESSTKRNTDILPSLGVVLGASDKMNLRLSYGRTVARPQLRELAPFIFTNYLGAREEFGNPNLERTRIDNLDARGEFFPSNEEVLAATLFYKRFLSPIEPTVIQTTRGVDSYENARGGYSFGLELEGRKRLSFLLPALREFTLVGNVTFLASQVDLDPTKLGGLTSLSRPIAGQAPFVVNAALDWEHNKSRLRVLYNVAGSRIYRVGAFGLPDIYERPRHGLDLAFAQGIGEHLDFKVSLENILNAPFRFTHGNSAEAPITQRWTTGQSLWLGATYTY
jgi:TonB-dependent receptor